MSKRAVFLDRDDTIIRDKVYLSDPGGVELLPDAAKAVRVLNDRQVPVIVVTNQSGIARGIFDEERLSVIHKRLMILFAEQGARIDAIYYCPHHPQGVVGRYAVSCLCRKPKPGMLLQAKKDFGLDLCASFMIGDKPEDIEAMHEAGGRGVLIRTVKNRESRHEADFVAKDLMTAVEWIVCAMEGAPVHIDRG